jgi:hypothetical protein
MIFEETDISSQTKIALCWIGRNDFVTVPHSKMSDVSFYNMSQIGAAITLANRKNNMPCMDGRSILPIEERSSLVKIALSKLTNEEALVLGLKKE